MKICFTASSGGHLEQLMMLFPLMNKYESCILTEKTIYNSENKNIKSYFVNQINRKEIFFVFKFILLICQSLVIFFKEKPDVIISTGALGTIPILLIGKLFRRKIIFIESFSKISSPTITGKFMYKFADIFIVQWKEMKKFYPNAIYGGTLY